MNHENNINNFLEHLTKESEHIAQYPNYEPEYLYVAHQALTCALGSYDLPRLVDTVRQELIERIRELERAHPDYILNDFSEFADSVIYELAENACPVYYWQLSTLYYLYAAELEEAHEDYGILSSKDQHIQSCITVYLSQYLEDNTSDIIKQALQA